MNIAERWKGIGSSRQGLLAAGLLVIVAITAVLIYVVLRMPSVPLFTDLSARDSATVVAQLESMSAEYVVDQETGQVRVPEDQRDSLRLALMEKGLPLQGPVGFELFDKADFGMTEFSQRINYQRGLEGELIRTIMALDGVRYARLHLVLPDSTLFKRDREQTKAAVTLITASDKPVTASQIEGIRRLIAAAVPGLTPEMVSIHDHKGVDLATQGSLAGPAGAVSTRVQAHEAIEAFLSAKIYELLHPLFPADSVAVSIDATLRMDKVVATRDRALPGSRSAVSRIRTTAPKDTSVDSIAKSADAGTVPSMGGNPQFDVEYQVGHVQEQVEELPGAVERLSVAVLVPDPLPANITLAQITELVATAAGLDSSRGDRIAVHAIAFPTGSNPISPEAQPAADVPVVGPTATSLERKVGPLLSWQLGLVGILLLLLIIATLVALAARRSSSTVRLTSAERDLLLEKVRGWIRETPTPSAELRR